MTRARMSAGSSRMTMVRAMEMMGRVAPATAHMMAMRGAARVFMRVMMGHMMMMERVMIHQNAGPLVMTISI